MDNDGELFIVTINVKAYGGSNELSLERLIKTTDSFKLFGDIVSRINKEIEQ